MWPDCLEDFYQSLLLPDYLPLKRWRGPHLKIRYNFIPSANIYHANEFINMSKPISVLKGLTI